MPKILSDFFWRTDNISDDELVDDSDDVEDGMPWEKLALNALELFQKFQFSLQLMVILFSPIAKLRTQHW